MEIKDCTVALEKLKKENMGIIENVKIAIVGTHKSGYEAPFYDKDYRIWTLNEGFLMYPRIDKIFDMHDWITAEYIPAWYNELKKTEIIVIKPGKDKNIKHVAVYPGKIIKEIFSNFLLCTIAEMIAFAAIMGYRNIELYGIQNDYFKRQPMQGFSIYHTIGRAEGLGVKFKFQEGSGIMECKTIYGYKRLMIRKLLEDWVTK